MEMVAVLGEERSLVAESRVESLVLEHQIKLARYVRRFVGEREAALDLVQDVFFAAYRTLRADPERPLTGGWLYKTATNRAISHLRKCKRRSATVLDEARDACVLGEESAASIDLQRALAALAPEQLACVMLTTYAGYTSHEAAEMLGIGADAVRQRVCRAMRVMRKRMVVSA